MCVTQQQRPARQTASEPLSRRLVIEKYKRLRHQLYDQKV